MTGGPTEPGARRAATPAWVLARIEALPAGSFALVMATGIISNAFWFEGPRPLSDALFALNVAAYGALLGVLLLRALRAPGGLLAELLDPRRTFSFFAFVAATDVLGAAVKLRGLGEIALVMWLAALAAWFALVYASFGVLAFRNNAHDADVADGGWLLAIVGAQSLAALGGLIAPSLGPGAAPVFALAHMLWGVGLALYAIYVTLFAERIFFFAFAPDDITPALWVVMGAAAITANSGAVLFAADGQPPFLQAMRGFIGAVTLIAWAWATWWIPLLALLGIWKHGWRRAPLGYSLTLWSMVFPLGMYALASWRLSRAADLAALGAVARVMVWIALAAWAATAFGLARATWRGWRGILRGRRR